MFWALSLRCVSKFWILRKGTKLLHSAAIINWQKWWWILWAPAQLWRTVPNSWLLALGPTSATTTKREARGWPSSFRVPVIVLWFFHSALGSLPPEFQFLRNSPTLGEFLLQIGKTECKNNHMYNPLRDVLASALPVFLGLGTTFSVEFQCHTVSTNDFGTTFPIVLKCYATNTADISEFLKLISHDVLLYSHIWKIYCIAQRCMSWWGQHAFHPQTQSKDWPGKGGGGAEVEQTVHNLQIMNVLFTKQEKSARWVHTTVVQFRPKMSKHKQTEPWRGGGGERKWCSLC